jgi:hypothetical protein
MKDMTENKCNVWVWGYCRGMKEIKVREYG